MTFDLSRELQVEGVHAWTVTSTFVIGAFRLPAACAFDEIEDVEKRFCFGLNDIQCEVTVEGEGCGMTGADTLRFHQPGDRLLARKAQQDGWDQTWVVLSEEFLQSVQGEPLFATSFVRPHLRHLAAMRAFFRRVEHGECPVWVEETLTALLSQLLQNVSGTAPRRGLATARQRNLALQADELLTQRFFKPLKLSEIARELGVTAPHLARSYRATMGAHMHERLMSLRLAAALVRLGNGVADLTSLALDLGFASHSHFTAAFHQYIGVPPSQYRANCRKA